MWSKQQDGGDLFLGLMSLDVNQLVLDDAAYWYPLQGRRGKNDVVSGEICLAFDHPPYVVKQEGETELTLFQPNARQRW